MSSHDRSAALADHIRQRLLLDLFGGAIVPRTIYPVFALADAYSIDVETTRAALEQLRADRIVLRPLEGHVAFMPWTAASMLQRAVDLRYLAAHSPVTIPPPAPLVDFRAGAGPADLDVGLRFAGRLLDVPGHQAAARLFERSAALFAAYFVIRAAQDPVIGEELKRARKALVDLFDSPFAFVAPVDVIGQQVVVKRALVSYLREHERLHEMVREAALQEAALRR